MTERVGEGYPSPDPSAGQRVVWPFLDAISELITYQNGLSEQLHSDASLTDNDRLAVHMAILSEGTNLGKLAQDLDFIEAQDSLRGKRTHIAGAQRLREALAPAETDTPEVMAVKEIYRKIYTDRLGQLSETASMELFQEPY